MNLQLRLSRLISYTSPQTLLVRGVTYGERNGDDGSSRKTGKGQPSHVDPRGTGRAIAGGATRLANGQVLGNEDGMGRGVESAAAARQTPENSWLTKDTNPSKIKLAQLNKKPRLEQAGYTSQGKVVSK